MKGLDTNILARYLRDDDPERSRRAARLIERAVNQQQPLFLNHLVLCEIAWILSSVYGHSKAEMVQTGSEVRPRVLLDGAATTLEPSLR
jgi:predicted nucleic-acid-binding protein